MDETPDELRHYGGVADYWSNGDPILLREIYRGRAWAVRPVRVVEGGPDRVML